MQGAPHRQGAYQFESLTVPEQLQRKGIGSQIVREAKGISDATGQPHHWVKATRTGQALFGKFDHWTDAWDRGGWTNYEYDPAEAAQSLPPATSASTGPLTCPTCGDALKGAYGTFCSRCQWSEHDVKLDDDNLSNPQDPTVEMHREVQSRWLPAVDPL